MSTDIVVYLGREQSGELQGETAVRKGARGCIAQELRSVGRSRQKRKKKKLITLKVQRGGKKTVVLGAEKVFNETQGINVRSEGTRKEQSR